MKNAPTVSSQSTQNNQLEQGQYSTDSAYLKKKDIDLAALQSACHSTVEVRQGSIVRHDEDGNRIAPYEGQFLFRELVNIKGDSAGFERILPERISKEAGSKPNDKFSTPGSKVSGTFTPIGFDVGELISMSSFLIVCAGLADGYRLHEATGLPVACCVGENNIKSVVEAIIPLQPNLFAAVDNDEAGHRAGESLAIPWCCPNEVKDWSDLYQADGLEAVKAQFEDNIKSCREHAEDDPYGLKAAKVTDLLDTDPPAREWLVTDRLPYGVVGLLAAAGGTGKSMATLQLAISVCTGLPWLEMPMDKTGAVLMFSAEDDRDEIHRRLRTVLRVYSESVGPNPADTFKAHKQAIAERLHVFDRVGKDNRLTAKLNGEIQRTAFVRWVVEAAQQVPDLALIVLDPLARFDGGDPNDNADSTRLIECAEQVRKATGATVLLPHHVNKGSLKDPASGQEAVRGGSGLVDGSRWVGLLSSMRADTAEKEYGIDPEEAAKLVRFTTPKANYSAPWEGVWLRRVTGGALVPTIVEKADGKPERKSEERYASFLVVAKELIRKKEKEGEYLNVTKLRAYGGQEGIFSMGVGSVKTCIHRALEEGELFKRDDGTLRLF